MSYTEQHAAALLRTTQNTLVGAPNGSPDWYLELRPDAGDICLRSANGGSNDDTWWHGWTLQNMSEACALLAECSAA